MDIADVAPAPEPPHRICAPVSGSDTWSLALGSSPFDTPTIVRIADNGDLVLALIVVGTIDFGCETYTAAADAPDLLLARLDPRGRLLWAHHVEQAGYIPHDVDMQLDGSGHIVLTGSGAGDPSSFGGTTLAKGRFLLSFDGDGTLRWAQQISGSESALVRDWSLGVSAEGRILLSGGLSGTIDIGTWPIVEDVSESTVAVAAGWDQDGTPRFGHSLPFDFTTSLSVGGDGSATLVGEAGTDPYDGPRYPVVVKLSADGALLWQQSSSLGANLPSPGSLDASGISSSWRPARPRRSCGSSPASPASMDSSCGAAG